MRHWLKPTLTLVILFCIAWLTPVTPLDPWNLLSPRKIATMVFALALIQALGSWMSEYLGARNGAILTGFFGGLVSSTAATASLARRSKTSSTQTGASEMLTFLAATGAMLFEGLALVTAGAAKAHVSVLLVFIGPIAATLAMIFVQYRRMNGHPVTQNTSSFQILPILKLSLFIIAILSVSKISQNLFGENGLLVLTSLVSLFEIHGSIIANVQLHEASAISFKFLCSLLAVSVAASYFSKLFLIFTLGSPALRTRALKCTLVIFCSLALSWVIAMSFVTV